MKFARRFLFKAEDGQPNIVISGLDLMDILAHITFLIHYLYCKFRSNNPAIAKEFREMLTQVIAAPDSPAWEEDPNPGCEGAYEMYFTMDKEDAE